MKRRNPLLAGFLNVLIPGSGHWYVSNNWRKFLLFFVINSLIIFGAILVGNNIQRVREYTLPQGLCTGTLLLGIFALLFYGGMKMASERNSQTDSAAHYQSMRSTSASKEDPVARLAKLQRQRDEGLISSEQQTSKKAEIDSEKD